MFQMALLLLKGNNCAKLFWNPCIIVQVIVRTNPDGRTDARTHAHTPNKNCNNYVSLTRKRTWQKPCINAEAQFMTILSSDLQVWPWPWNVSNGISTPQGEQLCYIILKFMHKCRNYGPDKLVLLPFYHLTFKWDLDLQMFQMALLLLKENNYAKLFNYFEIHA